MNEPTVDYKAGFEDGFEEGYFDGLASGFEEGHENGFSRAVELIIGNKATWSREERLLFNRVTRKYFGKKRNVIKEIQS